MARISTLLLTKSVPINLKCGKGWDEHRCFFIVSRRVVVIAVSLSLLQILQRERNPGPPAFRHLFLRGGIKKKNPSIYLFFEQILQREKETPAPSFPSPFLAGWDIKKKTLVFFFSNVENGFRRIASCRWVPSQPFSSSISFWFAVLFLDMEICLFRKIDAFDPVNYSQLKLSRVFENVLIWNSLCFLCWIWNELL